MDIFLSAVNGAWQIKFSSLKISFYIFLYNIFWSYYSDSQVLPDTLYLFMFFLPPLHPFSLSLKKKKEKKTNPQKTKHEKPKTTCVCTDTQNKTWSLIGVGGLLLSMRPAQGFGCSTYPVSLHWRTLIFPLPACVSCRSHLPSHCWNSVWWNLYRSCACFI